MQFILTEVVRPFLLWLWNEAISCQVSGLCLGVCDQWSTGVSSSCSLSCRVAKWLKAEPERRKKLEEEKRKRLAMKKGESSKHYLEDHKYMEQIKSTEENMGDALKQGLEAASSSKGVKRKQPASNGTSKKAKLW